MGVTVGDVVLLLLDAVVGQSFDDNTQVGKTFIDVVGLFKSLSRGPRLLLPL